MLANKKKFLKNLTFSNLFSTLKLTKTILKILKNKVINFLNINIYITNFQALIIFIC